MRTSLAISQAELANAIGTTVTSISRIEKGHAEPRNSTVQKIAKTYNASLEWLLKGTGEMMLSGKLLDVDFSHQMNWTEEAFTTQKQYINTLEKEVEWLRGLVTKLTGSVNFPNGIDTAGMFLNPVNSVRAVA